MAQPSHPSHTHIYHYRYVRHHTSSPLEEEVVLVNCFIQILVWHTVKHISHYYSACSTTFHVTSHLGTGRRLAGRGRRPGSSSPVNGNPVSTFVQRRSETSSRYQWRGVEAGTNHPGWSFNCRFTTAWHGNEGRNVGIAMSHLRSVSRVAESPRRAEGTARGNAKRGGVGGGGIKAGDMLLLFT